MAKTSKRAFCWLNRKPSRRFRKVPTDDRAVLPVLAALTKSKPTLSNHIWHASSKVQDRDRSRKYFHFWASLPVSVAWQCSAHFGHWDTGTSQT